MSFSYLIKYDNQYLILDNSNLSINVYWKLIKDRKYALYMTEDYANTLLIEVKKHLPKAIIIGVEYAQN